jgi:signal transduction histidine kinase
LCAFRNRTAPGAIPFFALVISIMLWLAAHAMGLTAASDSSRIFWYTCHIVLILPTISAALCFVLEYAGLDRVVNRRTVGLLASCTIVFGLLVLTNAAHNLVWTRIWYDGGIHVVRGPVAWLLVFYGGCLSLLHIVILIRLFIRSRPHRGIVAGLLLSALLIRAGWLFHTMKWNPFAPFDLYILVVNLALFPYFLAILRGRMFEAVPVGRNLVIERMIEGMMILDNKNRIVDLNPAVQKLLCIDRSAAMRRPVDDILAAHPELLRLIHEAGCTRCEHPLGDMPPRWYEVSVSPLIDRRDYMLGRLFLLQDVTARKQKQEKILEQEQKLAILNERELLGRELHDGIGQMLAVAQLQSVVAREYLVRGDTEAVASNLNRIAEVTQEAKEHIRDYLLGIQAAPSREQSLPAALNQYLRQYGHRHGIQTELVVRPELENQRFDASIEAQLPQIIYEALTNARRHSGATAVRVNVTYGGGKADRPEADDRKIVVTVEDNGKGFDLLPPEARQGFGLRSMQGRADMLGAHLGIESTPNGGCRVIIQVPWPIEPAGESPCGNTVSC